MIKYKRGAVYWTDMGDVDEYKPSRCIKKTRPCIIISPEWSIDAYRKVTVLPLTTHKDDSLSHRFIEGISEEMSYIVPENITTVDLNDIKSCIGFLTEAEMQIVNNQIAISLGLGTAHEVIGKMKGDSNEK